MSVAYNTLRCGLAVLVNLATNNNTYMESVEGLFQGCEMCPYGAMINGQLLWFCPFPHFNNFQSQPIFHSLSFARLPLDSVLKVGRKKKKGSF